MQTWARISTLLMLLLPFLLKLTPAAEAHGSVKVGCLNYGHSCLGAHGKRGSWPPSAPRTNTAAALLGPLLQGLAAPPSNAARSWEDKVMQRRQQQQQSQKQQQHEDFPAVYEDLPLSRRHPLPALPASQNNPALDEDDMAYYGTYEEDYADHRAKRSVSAKTKKQQQHEDLLAMYEDAPLSRIPAAREDAMVYHGTNQEDHPLSVNQEDHPLSINQEDHHLSANQEDHHLSANQEDHPLSANQEDHPLSVNQEDHPLSANHNTVALDEDAMVHYGTYGEDRAKRSVSEKTKKKPRTEDSMNCLLFSRQC